MFDCVWPTRTARFGNAVTSIGVLNLKNSRYAEDFSPVEPGCGCICCRPKSEAGLAVTKAYIHHLAAKETVGAHLLTLHNVFYQLSLMRQIRQAIIDDRYPAFMRQFFLKLHKESSKVPTWVANALSGVGVDISTWDDV